MFDYDILTWMNTGVTTSLKSFKLDQKSKIKFSLTQEQYDVLEVGPSKYKELIHFGLTSQDINSVAFSLQLKDCMFGCMCPKIDNLLDLLEEKLEKIFFL